MKNRTFIGLTSCFTIVLLMTGSLTGSVFKAETTTIELKDLLIITPADFEQTLQPLVEHKEQFGIETMMVTLETILAHPDTAMGRDDAEKMKYYIKSAIEYNDISYVLLVGGKQGQRGSWHLPVRYVDMNNGWEPHYVSDLYFADIYDSCGKFSSWDSDRDGRYGEWIEGEIPDDQDIDLCPDISLGRIPCRNINEVEIMVNKIIHYETETKNIDRFNTFLNIAGDTYLESLNPLWKGYEGEIFAEYAIENMTGFTPTRMYLSEDGFSEPNDVINEFNKGYGFVYFVGHGSPKSWGTHKPNDHEFIDGLNTKDIKKLSNSELYSICIVSGCHNCQFDVGLDKLLAGFMEHGLGFLTEKLIYRYEWIPNGWGWLMTKNPQGGSIVTYGTTALGHTQEDKTSFAGGINEFERELFHQYGTLGTDHAGDVLKQAMNWYLDTYPVDWHATDDTILRDTWVDVQVLQSYIMMGDPSLMIGGY